MRKGERSTYFIMVLSFLVVFLFSVFGVYTVSKYNRKIEKIYLHSISYSCNYWADQFYVVNKELKRMIDKDDQTDFHIICEAGSQAAVGTAVANLQNDLTNMSVIHENQIVFFAYFPERDLMLTSVAYALLSTDIGYINTTVMKTLGLNTVSWYSAPKYWLVILVLVNQWKWLGYNAILYYSSIIGIDPSFYEAATIDGATRFQRIRYITVPVIRSTIITLLLLQLGSIFKSDFGLFYQVPMNSSALMNVTNTIDTYVYRGIKSVGTLGMASAAGFYQSVIGFVLVLIANALVRKVDPDSAIF